MSGLAVLMVGGESPARAFHRILTADPLVRSLLAAADAAAAFTALGSGLFDLVMLDVCMPGLDGLDFARTLSRFAEPPAIVLLAADSRRAAEAFDVGAVDYLLKPPTAERLHQALQRASRLTPARPGDCLEIVPVSLGARTRLVARTDVVLVEAAGDYVRLYTRSGPAYLARLPMSALERSWAEHGFARIHRSYLISLREVSEVRVDGAQAYVTVGGRELPVSRRHRRELRESLSRFARNGTATAPDLIAVSFASDRPATRNHRPSYIPDRSPIGT
jgi:DNA-binding LytR/AlgR family response regulator